MDTDSTQNTTVSRLSLLFHQSLSSPLLPIDASNTLTLILKENTTANGSPDAKPSVLNVPKVTTLTKKAFVSLYHQTVLRPMFMENALNAPNIMNLATENAF